MCTSSYDFLNIELLKPHSINTFQKAGQFNGITSVTSLFIPISILFIEYLDLAYEYLLAMKRFLLCLFLTFFVVHLTPLSSLLSGVTFVPLFFIIYILLGGLPWLRILKHTLPRDLFLSWTFLKISFEGVALTKKNFQIHHAWLETVAKNRDKTAVSYGDRKITFSEMNNLVNKFAHFFVSRGVKEGDTVALYSENRIEYVCVWLAFSKLGVVTALINNNLKGQSLVHSLKVAASKCVIFSPNCVEAVSDVCEELGEEIKYFSLGEIGGGEFVVL